MRQTEIFGAPSRPLPVRPGFQRRSATVSRTTHFRTSVRRTMTAGITCPRSGRAWRSEEHTSELQSLMSISYAVFCLKNKKSNTTKIKGTNTINRRTIDRVKEETQHNKHKCTKISK